MFGVLILDNSCLNRLQSPALRSRLRANLRATGREFWPTASNVLEALKSRDATKRRSLLAVLADLAGENHALTLPGAVLHHRAEAMAGKPRTFPWSEPRMTHVFRQPESVNDAQAAQARRHLEDQEASFRDAHAAAETTVRPLVKEAGGNGRWPSVTSFLDEVWTTDSHAKEYLNRLWREWRLGENAPVASLLSDEPWRLYLDGWGASIYARQIVHPQRRLVQHADLKQLVYLAAARNRVLATEDRGFRALANSVLSDRYALARVVELDALVA